MKTIRIGTRGSRLALWQANWVKDALLRAGLSAETVVIHTRGDRQTQGPLERLGATGVFTKEIQRGLLDGDVDLAVHSMKDLPTDPVPGIALIAVPARFDVRDVWVSNKFRTLAELTDGARVGTGSERRRCQLLNRFGDRVRVENIRGNVETRLAQLDEGKFDAIILAVAGLARLGLADRIRPEAILDPSAIYPAVGQGALAIEARTCDREVCAQLEALNDKNAMASALAERAMLRTLEGGCIAPIGAYSTIEGETLTLSGRILSLDGRTCFDAQETMPLAEAEALGKTVAEKLIQQGAGEILETLRNRRLG